MNYRRRTAVVITAQIAVGCATLHAQMSCQGLLVPLKPTSMFSCPSATSVCVSDPNGLHGHWVWMCPAGTTPGNGNGLDPTIPLRVRPPSIDNPLDIAIQAEQLRQLRLQNQQMTQQQVPASNIPNAELLKTVYSCGVLDGMLKALEAAGNTEGVNIAREALRQTTCEQVRAQMGADANIETVATPPLRQPDTGFPLGNAGVLEMVRAGLKEDTIIHVIHLRPPYYSLSQTDRSKLREAGVSEAIIQAMVEKSAGQ